MRNRILWITFWMTMVYWLGGAWGCSSAGDRATGRLSDAPSPNPPPQEWDDSPRQQTPRWRNSPYTTPPLERALIAMATAATAEPVEAILLEPQPQPEPDAGTESATQRAGDFPDADPDSALAPDSTPNLDPDSEAAGDSDTKATGDGELERMERVLERELTPRGQATVVEQIDEPAPTTTLDRSHWPKIATGPADGRTTHFPRYYRDFPLHHQEMTPRREAALMARVDAALHTDTPGHYDRTNLAALLGQPVKFGLDTVLLPFRAIVNWPLQKDEFSGAPAHASPDPTETAAQTAE